MVICASAQGKQRVRPADYDAPVRAWTTFLLLALAAAACTSGVSFAQPAPSRPDAGLAPDCGVPGKRCCLGNECREGGCCVNARCVAQGASCGEEVKGTCRA